MNLGSRKCENGGIRSGLAPCARSGLLHSPLIRNFRSAGAETSYGDKILDLIEVCFDFYEVGNPQPRTENKNHRLLNNQFANKNYRLVQNSGVEKNGINVYFRWVNVPASKFDARIAPSGLAPSLGARGTGNPCLLAGARECMNFEKHTSEIDPLIAAFDLQFRGSETYLSTYSDSRNLLPENVLPTGILH